MYHLGSTDNVCRNVTEHAAEHCTMAARRFNIFKESPAPGCEVGDAWRPAGQIMRGMQRRATLIAFLLQLSADGEPCTPVQCHSLDRSYCHVGKWDEPPRNVPLDGGADSPKLSAGGTVDGPISGNGDFGLVVGTNEHTPTANQGSWLLMYVDTMHFRDVQNDVGAVGARDESGSKRGLGYLRVGPATRRRTRRRCGRTSPTLPSTRHRRLGPTRCALGASSRPRRT